MATPNNFHTPPSSIPREPSFSYNPATQSEVLDESPQTGGSRIDPMAHFTSHMTAQHLLERAQHHQHPQHPQQKRGGGGRGGGRRQQRPSGPSFPSTPTLTPGTTPVKALASHMAMHRSESAEWNGSVPVVIAPQEPSAVAATLVNSAYSSRVLVGMERVLVVHFVHNERMKHVSPSEQLASQARVAVPGIVNYLFLRASKVAVVYLGKVRTPDGVKVGIRDGEDLKRKVIRFMTTEIWPPLRTDVPDDSLPHKGSGGGDRRRSSVRFQIGQSDQMQALVYLKSGALGTSYVKLVLCAADTLHFDIVDHKDEKHRWENRKLHIRMLDSLETQKAIYSYEQYERAFRDACVFSEEHADRLSRLCANSSVIVQCYERPSETLSEGGSFGTTPPGTNPSAALLNVPGNRSQRSTSKEWFGPLRKHYSFFERLQKPESATLDYKSYFANPATEIKEKAVKFMCGFLNAYGYGRLIVGVHEMPLKIVVAAEKERQRSSAESPAVGGTSPKPDMHLPSRAKDDNNEQIVVGVSINKEELEDIRTTLSEQLAECVPPIPASALRVDCAPVVLPPTFGPIHVLVLYETTAQNWKDHFRQKANCAIRSLSRHKMSLCPIPCEGEVANLVPDEARHVSCFAIINPAEPVGWEAARTPSMAPKEMKDLPPMDSFSLGPSAFSDDSSVFSGNRSISDVTISSKRSNSSAEPLPNWWQELQHHLPSVKSSKNHIIAQLRDQFPLPELYVIDISVNVNRMDSVFTNSYKHGKFFNGWPSIPVWNTASHAVTRVERHYDLFTSRNKAHLVPGSKCWWNNDAVLPAVMQFITGAPSYAQDQLQANAAGTALVGQHHSHGSVVAPLCCTTLPAAWLSLRLVHTSFNEVFQQLIGMDVILAISSRSVGTMSLKSSWEAVCQTQASLQASRLPHLPLLYTWVYRLLGGLPSPYPYVTVPLALQPLRLAPYLIPVYMLGGANAARLEQHVVLDARDGILKRVLYDRVDPSRVSDVIPIRGVGFAPIDPEAAETYRREQQARTEAEQQLEAAANRRKARMSAASASLAAAAETRLPKLHVDSTKGSSNAFAQQEQAPAIEFRFLDAATSLGTTNWTLRHLLVWLQVATNDSHVKPNGHCARSFAFECDLTTEVCTAHFQTPPSDVTAADSMPTTPDSSVRMTTPQSPYHTHSLRDRYPSFFDCALHRAEYEWVQWE